IPGLHVTGVQTCALPISHVRELAGRRHRAPVDLAVDLNESRGCELELDVELGQRIREPRGLAERLDRARAARLKIDVDAVLAARSEERRVGIGRRSCRAG